MRRTSILLNPEHLKQLAKIGAPTGARPSQLVRTAIAEFIERAAQKKAAK